MGLNLSTGGLKHHPNKCVLIHFASGTITAFFNQIVNIIVNDLLTISLARLLSLSSSKTGFTRNQLTQKAFEDRF